MRAMVTVTGRLARRHLGPSEAAMDHGADVRRGSSGMTHATRGKGRRRGVHILATPTPLVYVLGAGSKVAALHATATFSKRRRVTRPPSVLSLPPSQRLGAEPA